MARLSKERADALYIDILSYRNKEYPFQFFIGGRGTGKTYSSLEGIQQGKCKGKPFWMRRTVNEWTMLLDSDRNGEAANPFKKLNSNVGSNLGMKKIVTNLGGIYDRTVDENGKFLYSGAPMGYSGSLSGMASVRGTDFSDVTDIFYDEFVKELHVSAIRGEYSALMNAYETINRNREFDGEEPCYLWCMSNADDIYNPIFVGLGVVDDCEKMMKTGKIDKYYPGRGLAIHLLPNKKEFDALKKQTAIAKLTKGTQFAEVAYNNSFAYNDFSLIGYRDIKGYIPVCKIDDITIWKKKGEQLFYCTYASAKCPLYTSDKKHQATKFIQDYGHALWDPYMQGHMFFETYDIKARLVDILF